MNPNNYYGMDPKQLTLDLHKFLGNGLRYDLIATSGKSQIEMFLERVILEAWKMGIKEAAEMVRAQAVHSDFPLNNADLMAAKLIRRLDKETR